MGKIRKVLMSMLFVFAMVIGAMPVHAATPTESLQAALNAGGTVTLTESVELTEGLEIPSGTEVTLDLNGKTLNYVSNNQSTDYLIRNEGSLTITDSSANKDGAMTVLSNYPATDPYPYASNVISNYGTVTIKAGTIENKTNGGACYALDNYVGSTATIDGGKLIAAKTSVRVFQWTNGEANKVTLNVNGGEIISKDGYGINFNMGNNPYVELNITGGKISTQDTDYELATYIVSKGNASNVKINVENGEFDGYFALNGLTATTMATDNVSISGGEMTGVIAYDTPVYGFVTGGTFTDAPSSEVLVSGYEVAADGSVFAPISTKDTFLTAVANGGTVKLTENITLDSTVVINKNTTIDTNGKTITSTAGVVFNVLNKLTVTGNGSIGGAGDIFVMGTKGSTVNNVVLNLESGLNVASTANCAVVIYDGTLNTEANLVTEAPNYAVIQGTGGSSSIGPDDNTVININGGTITNENNHAIYHPQYGTVNMNAGTVKGTVGIEMRAGTLNVNGGTIIGLGTYDETTNQKNGNGSTVKEGVAVVVSPHTTLKDIATVIDGGTLDADMSFVEILPEDPCATPEVAITGGTHKGGIYAEESTGFITGGRFNEKFDNSYLANGLELDGSGRVTRILPKATVEFVVDGKVWRTYRVTKGADIRMPEVPEKEGYVGEWDHDGENIRTATTITAVYTKVEEPVNNTDLSDYADFQLPVYANSRVTNIATANGAITVEGYMFKANANLDNENSIWREIIFVNEEDYSMAKAYRKQVTPVYNTWLNKNMTATGNGTYALDYANYTVTFSNTDINNYVGNTAATRMATGSYLAYMRISDGKDSYLFPLKDIVLSDGSTLALPSGFEVVDTTTRALRYIVK